MKRAAAGRYQACAAHPAACWEPDTIPKPDGLARPRCGPESNGDRAEIERCPVLSGSRSSRVRRRLSTGGPAAGFLLEDHRIEHLLDDLLGLRVEAGDGLELELEGFIRPALILAKQATCRN